MIFLTLVAVGAILYSPSHAATHHRHNARNANFLQLQDDDSSTINREKSLSEKFDGTEDIEGLEFLQDNSEETNLFKKRRYSDHFIRKRGAYDLNGPSEKRALMEYYASMIVTSADPADRLILKEKLGKALERNWPDFDSFKNYCDKLADEITSYDVVLLDDDFDLTDHLYSIIRK